MVEFSAPNSSRPDLRLLAVLTLLGSKEETEGNMYPLNVTYSVDMSQTSPSFLEVNIPDLPFTNTEALRPAVLNADWLLAAMGISNNATLNTTREFARRLSEAVPEAVEGKNMYYANYEEGLRGSLRLLDEQADEDAKDIYYIAYYTALHAASLVGYNYTELSDAEANVAAANGDHADPLVLKKNIRYQAYAYGLDDSRTSKLGVAIVIVGAVIVVARAVLKLMTRVEDTSAMELMIAALSHTPEKGERSLLDGKGERETARLRWRAREGKEGRHVAGDNEGNMILRESEMLDFEVVANDRDSPLKLSLLPQSSRAMPESQHSPDPPSSGTKSN